MKNNENKGSRLQLLSKSDYQIVDEEPNIDGYKVTIGNRKIGEVEDLLFDERSRKVRYIVVKLDEDELDLDDDREVLVPIGLAELHEDGDVVELNGVSVEQMLALPAFNNDKVVGPGYERQVRSVFTAVPDDSNDDIDDTFYTHESFNEDRLYHRRMLPPSNTSQPKSTEIRGIRTRNRPNDDSFA